MRVQAGIRKVAETWRRRERKLRIIDHVIRDLKLKCVIVDQSAARRTTADKHVQGGTSAHGDGRALDRNDHAGPQRIRITGQSDREAQYPHSSWHDETLLFGDHGQRL